MMNQEEEIKNPKELAVVIKELKALNQHIRHSLKQLEKIKELKSPPVSTEERNARKTLGFIKLANSIVHGDLTRKTQFMTKHQREEIIESLLTGGNIKMDCIPPTEMGGRPKIVYSYIKDLN